MRETGTTATAETRLVELGRVNKPHGLKGALRIQIWSQSTDNLPPGARLTFELADGSSRAATLRRVACAGRFFLIELEGLDTVEAAGLFRGARLLRPRADLAPGLYLDDLRGATVEIEGLGVVGTVTGLDINPAGQCYGVVGSRGYVAVFLPAVVFEEGRIRAPRQAWFDLRTAVEDRQP